MHKKFHAARTLNGILSPKNCLIHYVHEQTVAVVSPLPLHEPSWEPNMEPLSQCLKSDVDEYSHPIAGQVGIEKSQCLLEVRDTLFNFTTLQ